MALPGPIQFPAKELIALVPDPIAIFSENRTLATANAGFQRAFAAIEPCTRPGADWSIFLAEASRHGVLAPEACDELSFVAETLLDQVSEAPAVAAKLPDGTRYDIQISALSSGGFALTLRPSSVTADALDAERELEELMAKVLEACPTSLTMSRIGNGQILYRSPAATALLGKSRNSNDQFASREERGDFLTALLPDARVDDMLFTGRRGDGSPFPASISARIIDYRGEDVVVSSITDLSDEIAMRTELERQKEHLFRIEKMSALGELLAGVAHELNNPLSIVVGNAVILKEETADPGILRRVEKISDAAERCVRIVRTFLSMARERPLDLDRIDVASVVGTAIDSFEAGEGGGAVTCTVDLPPDLPAIVVDETQIVQVLTNLFINAAQAMADAGTGDRITVSGRLMGDPGSLRLTVSDNGPGIPAAVAGRIFDPLFTTKSVGKGTGVGLALCQRIITAHGGAIALEPGEGNGATFLIDLPVAKADDRP